LRNKNFRESLEDDHPSLDGYLTRKDAAVEDGAEVVSRQLDELNSRFGSAAEGLTEKIREIGERRMKEEKHDDGGGREEDQELMAVEDQKEVGIETEEKRGSSRMPDVKVS
jgi:hypothetical protein